MARYPGALWLPIPENSTQSKIVPTQFICHSVVAPWTVQRLREFWRDSTNLESHFGVDYTGAVGQYVDTAVRADANASANRRAVSVETASNLSASDPWNARQLDTLADLMVWAGKKHHIPFRICPSSTAAGFGYHRMFASWSTGGTNCPGNKRAQQFTSVLWPMVLKRAKAAPARTYTVKAGDTLSAIAARYGTTVGKLVLANGIRDADRIGVGQVLKIP